METGLLINGRVVPNTARIRRDPAAMWVPGERGTKVPARIRDLLCFHWTAGEAGIGSYEDDGPTVVRNTKARRSKKTGELLVVGFDFVIGACHPDDYWAPIWQTADPALFATVHVGYKPVYKRALSCEIVNAARPGKLDLRHRPQLMRRLCGNRELVLDFFPGQYRSAAWLADLLTGGHAEAATALTAAGIIIPRQVPRGKDNQSVLLDRMTPLQIAKYRGTLEHLHVPGTKLDAAGLVCEHLVREHDWPTVELAA